MVNNSCLRKIERVLFLAILSIATLLTFGLPAAKAKAEANDLLLSDERYQAQIAVLREMTDNTFTAGSVKELRGTGGEPEFLVFEGSPGYAVYSEADDAVLEFSTDTLSPYDGLSGDNLYYFGDGAYYVLENGEFLHITTGQTLRLADAEATLGVGLDDSVAVQSADDGVTYVTELTFSDVSISSFSGATDSPFYKMRSATEFGKNLYGTCAGVAANMLMQYYSDQYCPGFLPCYYKNGNTVVDDFKNLSWIGSQEVVLDGQTINAYYAEGDSVAEKRHKYIYNKIVSKRDGGGYFDGASLNVTYKGMREVLSDANCNAYSLTIAGREFDFLQATEKGLLISQLRCGPVVAGIYTMKNATNNSYGGNHSVVIYKSYTTNGKTYFLAHMGHDSVDWGDSVNQYLYATIIPEDYLQNYFIYMTPLTSERHILSNVSNANGYHVMQCSNCAYLGHSFITTHLTESSYDGTMHTLQCKYRHNNSDYYEFCPLYLSQVHTFAYRNKTAKLHLKYCSECSYSTSEAHLFIRNSSGKGVCVCGRIAGNGDPIIINKKPEETS